MIVENMRALGKKSKKDFCISRTPEYVKAMKKRRRERPEVFLHERVSRMFGLALQGKEISKGGRTFEMLGYTPQELVIHIERQFLKGMTWENRNKWQIDHIIPISSTENEEDIIRLNQLSNLRPLWSDENNRKKNKRLHLL